MNTMPPLPLELKKAEIRIAGNKVSVSAHNLTVEVDLKPTTATAMWASSGHSQQDAPVKVQGVPAGVELVRLFDDRYGMRVWIGSKSIRVPIRTAYFEVLRRHETAAREEGTVHVG